MLFIPMSERGILNDNDVKNFFWFGDRVPNSLPTERLKFNRDTPPTRANVFVFDSVVFTIEYRTPAWKDMVFLNFLDVIL